MNSTEQRRDKYVVIIGDSNMDIVGSPRESLRQFDPVPGDISYHPGGVARNEAVNLARLGIASTLISCFGNDANGQALMTTIESLDIDVSASLIVEGASTSTCMMVHDHTGEKIYSLGSVSIIEHLTPDALARQQHCLQRAELIITNTVLGEAALEYVFTHAAGHPVFVDTVCSAWAERIRPWLATIHTLKPNRFEASQLSGLPFTSREHAQPIADWFHHAGVRQVVLSLGAYGLYFSDGVHRGWMPPLSVDIVNTHGAGDALMAGLAYGWLEGLPFVQTVRFAAACAAMTLTCRENCHPDLAPERVEALLRAHEQAPAQAPDNPFHPGRGLPSS